MICFCADFRSGDIAGQWGVMASVDGHYSDPYSPTDGIVAFLSRKSSLPLHCPLPGAPCQERWGDMTNKSRSAKSKSSRVQKPYQVQPQYKMIHKCIHLPKRGRINTDIGLKYPSEHSNNYIFKTIGRLNAYFRFINIYYNKNSQIVYTKYL